MHRPAADRQHPPTLVHPGTAEVDGQRTLLTGLFDASLDGVVVVDGARRCVYANPAVCRTIGCGPETLLGRDVLTIFPSHAHGVVREFLTAAEAGQSRRLIAGVVKPNGEERQIESTTCPIAMGGEPLVAIVMRDETETQRLARKAGALAQIVSSVAFARSLEATLDALARTVAQATGSVACGVVLIDDGEQRARVYGTYGLPRGHRDAWDAVLSAGAPPLGLTAVQARQPVVVRDVLEKLLSDPRYEPVYDLVRDAAWDTIVSVPMRYWGRIVGALNVFYPQGRNPGEAEIDFLTAIADQAAVAAENARLFVEARDKAALEERQRLARELHDSVSQALYGIALGARTARTLLDRDPPRAAEPLDYVLSLAEAGLAEMRALIFELHPESLETEGLVAALDKQAAAVQARHGIMVHAALPEEPDLPVDVKQEIYRIAREGLNNIVKHARAGQAQLRLDWNDQEVVLEVSDDGVGFDSEASFPGHLGLRSMRERASNLGGTVEVESAPAQGTRICVRIPQSTVARLS